MIDMNPKMGVTSSRAQLPQPGPDPSLVFSAAGILFTNQTHVLAGYQPHKEKPCITGIGGSKNEGETAIQTAWRETIEELLESDPIPREFLTLCEKELAPTCWFSRGEYICFQYSFEDLMRFLKLAKQNRLTTSVDSS